MRILLIGLGRMGLRHAKVLKEMDLDVFAVEPRLSNNAEVESYLSPQSIFSSLDRIPAGEIFDAAIVAATADVRAKQLGALLDRGVPNIFLEKPLCQTRAQLQNMCAAADRSDAKISVHLYRRLLPAYQVIRQRHKKNSDDPIFIAVTSGASGLAGNGVHWIDFALWLSGSDTGKLLFGELNSLTIDSGRGPQFKDFGGTALYGFPDGSRLFLTILANSSGPAAFSIYENHHAVFVDQERDVGITYDRDPASKKPFYLYGQDYLRGKQEGVEAVNLGDNTRRWITSITNGEPSPLPSLAEARVAHDLLFDLLETGGQTEFVFT